MHVQEAINSRRSIRDFLPTPVPGDVIRRVLTAAARSPSGGNLQPWLIDVVAGEPLEQFKQQVKAMREGPGTGEKPEYSIYPSDLTSPYRERRFQVGEDMYALLGVPREDKAARLRWFARNYKFFGAPMALFISMDRSMGAPQWSDMGMFLQTVMLLLRAEGLDSCAQEAWSVYPETVGKFLGLPQDRLLFCGMAIGYRNPAHPLNDLVTRRAPLEEFARFRGV